MIQLIPPSWRMVKLEQCLQRRKGTVMPASLSEVVVGLVGLEDIQDGGRGGITVRQTKPQEIESLKTQFIAGDILYGKLRPYLNKVGIASESGLCSTEIWAFGPSPNVDSRFAAFFLASSFFVDRVASRTKGANLPRLDTEAFDSIEIPLPPLSEQKRIVEILQEAEEIGRLRTQAEAKTADLIQAIFNEYSCATSERKNRPLGTWFKTTPNYGTMTPADTETGNDGVICLRVGNIQNNRFELSEQKYVQRSQINHERHTVKAGDIILARAIASQEHLGKAVVVTQQEDGFAFDSHLMRIRLRNDELIPEFLQVYLYSAQGRNAFLKQARQSAVQFNVNSEEMARVLVPDVPPAEQMKVVERIKETESIYKTLEASSPQFSQLCSSLSARAFSGKLTATWRDANSKQLAHEISERDKDLQTSRPQMIPVVPHATSESKAFAASIFQERTDGIHSDLNREQRFVLREIKRMVGGVDYIRYFNAEMLGNYIDKAPLRKNPQAIEGHLAVLAVRGLLISVSREEQTEDTGEYLYGNAYRLPLKESKNALTFDGSPITLDGAALTMGTEPGDKSRLREMERLVGKLEKERMMK